MTAEVLRMMMEGLNDAIAYSQGDCARGRVANPRADTDAGDIAAADRARAESDVRYPAALVDELIANGDPEGLLDD